MTKAIKLLGAVALSSAFASSAFACNWNKSASHDMSPIASIETKSEEAMTTFDPQTAPAFEAEAEAKDETIKMPVEEKAE